MGTYAFWGGFAAVALAAGILTAVVRRKLRRLSQEIFGTASIFKALHDMNLREASPRSVNANDRMILPRIQKDFPDFDGILAKSAARDYLTQSLSGKKNLKIHRIAYTDYLAQAGQKAVVFQAAVGWRENGEKVEKRFSLHYTYMIVTSDRTVAANCPNCGAPIGYGAVSCSYCGAQVVNVMKNTWRFTELTEC